MKKALQAALPLLLLVAMIIVYPIQPPSRMVYSDIVGHEAMEDILYWGEQGVMSGSEGKFRPEGEVTLAELATVLCRILPLEEVSSQVFADVEEGAWFEDAVRKCVAAGIIESEGREFLYPREALRREEAFGIIARALQINPVGDARVLEEYNDGRFVREEFRGYAAALVEQDIVGGEDVVQLWPGKALTRGDLAAMLTRIRDGGYME